MTDIVKSVIATLEGKRVKRTTYSSAPLTYFTLTTEDGWVLDVAWRDNVVTKCELRKKPS